MFKQKLHQLLSEREIQDPHWFTEEVDTIFKSAVILPNSESFKAEAKTLLESQEEVAKQACEHLEREGIYTSLLFKEPTLIFIRYEKNWDLSLLKYERLLNATVVVITTQDLDLSLTQLNPLEYIHIDSWKEFMPLVLSRTLLDQGVIHYKHILILDREYTLNINVTLSSHIQANSDYRKISIMYFSSPKKLFEHLNGLGTRSMVKMTISAKLNH